MILSIFIILVALGLTYMHYLQGAFTSAISLGCAVVAAIVSLGYYETVINGMAQNGFTDYAAGLTVLVLFAVTYIVLRVLADMLVPGNIALPLYVERVGAGALGLAAGIIGAGVFAIGIQLMPLGPSIAGFAPYEMRDRSGVVVPAALTGRQRSTDSGIQDELAVDKFDVRSNLILPADSLVLSVVKLASDAAFGGTQSFAAIHPDLTAESFYTRLGADHSMKHVALNSSKQAAAKIDGVYTLAGPVQALDAELPELRPNKQSVAFKQASGDELLILRASFGDMAADKDGYVRMTTAAARLVIGDQTYFPIGTMEGGIFIALNRLDDLLALPFNAGTRSADLVYVVTKSALDTLTKAAPGGETPVFVELKLFGRVDLAGKKPETYATVEKTTKVVRKALSPLGVAAKIKPTN